MTWPICRVFHFALLYVPFAALAAVTAPADAQEMSLSGIGEVGQATWWSVGLEPTIFGEADFVHLVARGLVGATRGTEIGWLRIEGGEGRLRVSADFAALGGADVHIPVFVVVPPSGSAPDVAPDGDSEVDLVVPMGSGAGFAAEPSRSDRASGAAVAPAEVEIVTNRFPIAGRFPEQLILSLSQGPESGLASPYFELRLGGPAEIVTGGNSIFARSIRFVARHRLPPAEFSSGALEQVEVFSNLPSLPWWGEMTSSGVVFGGIPVVVSEGLLGLELNPARNSISGVELGRSAPSIARLVAPFSAGVAVSWNAAELTAGGPRAVAKLAAIELGPVRDELLGEVEARRTTGGWNLWFQQPGAVERVPVKVDGEVIGNVQLEADGTVVALTPEAPSGAEVFPVGFENRAFYGFRWEHPVPILVPGAGTFIGRSLRIEFARQIGLIAGAAVGGQDLPSLTLTGVAAPAVTDAGLCIASATTLCLAGGRFAVEANWTDSFGGSGAGVARPLSVATGAFWFFADENLELLIKVLDACAVNGHSWVFVGGLTDVEVQLTVTDTRTSVERVYSNAQGQAFQPIQDTAAFVCAP